ncbi:MAG: phosphotransferase family protein [Myxococcota bacterium]|nr:phosphotransferase family protein [Myxococcota bacterium]
MSPTADQEQQQVVNWVENTLGAKVIECERQARWRPAWFLIAERGTERLPLYFRGDRGLQSGGQYQLEHEFRILKILGEAGIPVPALHGFCDSPRGILMERVPGRADLSTALDTAERNSVQDDYMRILAEIHSLDIAPFEEAGLSRPASPAEMGLADFPVWQRGYARSQVRPDALLSFVTRWLHQNVPVSEAEPSFVCADSGQFLFDQGRVTAVIDLELAHIGDPAADLAGLRTRDLSEPLGDLRRATRRYSEITKQPIDPRLVDYHTVRFSIVTPLAIAPIIAQPPPGTDIIQYLCWYWVYARAALEVMAHMRGIDLEWPEEIETTPNRYSPAHQVLARSLNPKKSAQDFDAYQMQTASRLAEYIRRVDLRGPAIESADQNEVAVFLGSTPQNWLDREQQLESFVAESSADRDEDLIRFFHRRTCRHDQLLSPVMRELQNTRIQMLD